MTNKQIKVLKKRFGNKLDGKAQYFAYESFGTKREDLESAGFILLEDRAGWISAMESHSWDSYSEKSTLYKTWRDMFLEGTLIPEIDILNNYNDKNSGIHDETKKGMLKVILIALKDIHKHKFEYINDETKILSIWPEAINWEIRAKAIRWFLENRPKSNRWKYCHCDKLNET